MFRAAGCGKFRHEVYFICLFLQWLSAQIALHAGFCGIDSNAGIDMADVALIS